MIWSTNARELRRRNELFRSAKPPMPLPQQTDKMAKVFEERDIPFIPVDFFVLPPMAHRIGKIVIPFVSLDGRGKLIDNLPSFYAVTKRPDTESFEKDGLTRRIQESHVVAEDLSLRNGIFTPFGRTSAELFVVNTLAEAVQEGYIRDRIAHMTELVKEADGSEQLHPKQRSDVTEELAQAIDTLQGRIE